MAGFVKAAVIADLVPDSLVQETKYALFDSNTTYPKLEDRYILDIILLHQTVEAAEIKDLAKYFALDLNEMRAFLKPGPGMEYAPANYWVDALNLNEEEDSDVLTAIATVAESTLAMAIMMGLTCQDLRTWGDADLEEAYRSRDLDVMEGQYTLDEVDDLFTQLEELNSDLRRILSPFPDTSADYA